MNVGQMLAGLQTPPTSLEAQAAATGDISRAICTQAQTTNQTAQQNKINSDIQASQEADRHWSGDEQKANTARQLQHAAVGGRVAIDARRRTKSTPGEMAKFNQAFNYPQQQLGTLESSLGMTPHDTSSRRLQDDFARRPRRPWIGPRSSSKGAGTAADPVYGMSDRSMKTLPCRCR